MITSLEINEISLALAKAQGKMRNPDKNKTATIPMKAGGKYSFNYADLPGTFDTVRAALSEFGLSHSFGTKVLDNGVLCACRLSHSSGQWYESELLLPHSEDNKTLAANLTYLRRYLFTGLVGVAGEDDLDDIPEHEGATYVDRKPSPKPVADKAQAPAALSSAAEPKPLAPKAAAIKTITAAQRDHLAKLADQNGWPLELVVERMKKNFKKSKALDLSLPEYQELTAILATEKPGGTDDLPMFDGPMSVGAVQ